MTITQQIINIHEGKTARAIADELGIQQSYVRQVAYRYKLAIKPSPRHHTAKLTHSQAERIRHDFRPLACIAKDYGISTAQACRIRAGMHFNAKPMSAYRAGACHA